MRSSSTWATPTGASHGATWVQAGQPRPTSNDPAAAPDALRGRARAKEMLSRTTNADIHIPALEVRRAPHPRRVREPGAAYLDRHDPVPAAAIAAARAQPQELTGIFLSAARRGSAGRAHDPPPRSGWRRRRWSSRRPSWSRALCIGAARPSGPPVSGPPRQVSAPPGRPGGPRWAAAPARPAAPAARAGRPPRRPDGARRPGRPGVPPPGPARPMGPPQPATVNPACVPVRSPRCRRAGPMPPARRWAANRPVSTPPGTRRR
jgi:hypothetical protein